MAAFNWSAVDLRTRKVRKFFTTYGAAETSEELLSHLKQVFKNLDWSTFQVEAATSTPAKLAPVPAGFTENGIKAAVVASSHAAVPAASVATSAKPV